MKKIILVLLVMSLGFLFKTNAQAATLQLEVSATPTATPAVQPVEYFLPYPGILPDHLLYPLKTLRDKIMDFMIKDPLKKAEFELLTADKRLGAGKVLFEGGKPELGETTISKGEKYLQEALLNLEKAKNGGEKTGEALDKMGKAAQKHLEVIQGLIVKAQEPTKANLTKIMEGTQKVYQKILEMK